MIPATQEAEARGYGFEANLSCGELKASLGYLLRLYLKIKGGKKLRENIYNMEVEGKPCNILKAPKTDRKYKK